VRYAQPTPRRPSSTLSLGVSQSSCSLCKGYLLQSKKLRTACCNMEQATTPEQQRCQPVQKLWGDP
jgi:hypothetical protein